MLYLIKSGNFFKVGFSKRTVLQKRIEFYVTCNPDFEIVGLKNGTLKEEKEYHKCFNTLGLGFSDGREWFKYNEGVFNILKKQFNIDYKTLYPDSRIKPKPSIRSKYPRIREELTEELKGKVIELLNLSPGFYISGQLKQMLKAIYTQLNIKSKAKATDIQIYYKAYIAQRTVNGKSHCTGYIIE